MNTKRLISLLALTGSLGFIATTVHAQRPHTIDCDRGDSLQTTVNRQVGHAGPITITVSGTCEEDIFIGRDDVTINGNDSATIRGTVFVDDAHRILIQDLTISGPNEGLSIAAGGVRLINANISQNANVGLLVFRNSTVEIVSTTVSENGDFGVYVQRSAFEANDSAILENGSDGIGSEVGSETIVRNSKITGNLRFGVSSKLHSVTELRDATEVSGNSVFGAHLEQDAALRISTSDVIFPDTLNCHDTESSFANDGGVPTGPSNCTDFNQ